MMEALDRQKSLTGNQIKIIAAAMLGDMMEFFDYFLIGFVLAFVIKPWNLTYLQGAILLLSSGFGAMFGAAFWGWMADKVGRRIVFNATILNFSVATGLLYFTPDNGWEYMTAMRFFVGFGVGGLYCVDLPLVQEFMPARRRGMVGGLVTACIPVGTMIAGLLAANLTGAGAGVAGASGTHVGARISALADAAGPQRGCTPVRCLGIAGARHLSAAAQPD